MWDLMGARWSRRRPICSDTMHLLISFRKSTPPKTVNLIFQLVIANNKLTVLRGSWLYKTNQCIHSVRSDSQRAIHQVYPPVIMTRPNQARISAISRLAEAISLLPAKKSEIENRRFRPTLRAVRFLSSHTGSAVRTRQLWSGKEPGWSTLVSPNRPRPNRISYANTYIYNCGFNQNYYSFGLILLIQRSFCVVSFIESSFQIISVSLWDLLEFGNRVAVRRFSAWNLPDLFFT